MDGKARTLQLTVTISVILGCLVVQIGFEQADYESSTSRRRNVRGPGKADNADESGRFVVESEGMCDAFAST